MNKIYKLAKKTNIVKKTFAILAVSALLISCNEDDFLDLKNPNNPNNETFWVNKKNAESGLAAAYEPLQYQMDGWFGANAGYLDLQSRGDETWTVVGEELDSWQIATFINTISNSKYTYSRLFVGIQRANVVIKYVDLVPEKELNASDRGAIKGEAYFLRAYQYYLLANNYKEVPLRLVPSQEQTYMGPSSQEEIYAQVEKDLISAINLGLPIKRPSGEAGRIEKGAAVMLLAKVYATRHEYDKAKPLLEDLQKPPYKYALTQRYEDNFIPSGEYNSEYIYDIVYGQGAYSWGNGGLEGQGNSLPQWVGSPATGGWMKLAPSAMIISEFLKEKKTTGKANTYNGRNFDERMYSSFFFDTKLYGDARDESADWYDGTIKFGDMWIKATDQKLSKEKPEFPTVNGKEGQFLSKKYTAFFAKNASADLMNYTPGKENNIRVMRFAETLLLYAEACYKTNDEAGANAALAKIRDRAGLEPKTFSGQALWDEIVHQNLLEFYNEGRRFEDLRRWHSADEIKQIFIKNKKQGAENFSERYMYYPIPKSELDINKLMIQNSSWR